MRVFRLRIVFIIIIVFCVTQIALAQNNNITDFFPKMEYIESNDPAEGYFFMGSKGLTASDASHYITIIDNFGTPVFFRKMNKATSSIGLLKDGRIAYLNGVPRKLFFLNDMMEVTDTFSTEGFKPNGHDWDISDDGHVLLMGQVSKVVDMRLFVEGGDSLAEILDLVVQEFDENQNLLYTWNSADHFEITDGNENSPYLDFTDNQIDHVHANGISIDSDTSFLISCRHMDEITKVDRRTGDIIWRLGGKKNQFEFINDDLRFSHQHSIRALDNGNILLYDNGNLRTPQLSSAVEYIIDEENKTATLVNRQYRNPAVYSNHQGTTQRVYNGNTIINWGPYWPSFTEFHPDGTPALEWDFTKHSFCPRTEKFIWQTKVFQTNVDSVDFGTWESDTLVQSVWVKNNINIDLNINKVETRTSFFNIQNEMPIVILPNDSVEMKIWFNPDSSETGFFNDVLTIASDSETQRIARQIKVSGKKQENISPSASIITESTEVPLNSFIQIKFTEPIKISADQELDYSSVDPFIIFKKNNSEGENVAFNASISSDKTVITIYPETALNETSVYYLSLKEGLSDYSGNQLIPFEAEISTFITGIFDTIKTEAKINIFPNPASSSIIIQNRGINYSLKIYNISGTLLKQSYLSEQVHNKIDVADFDSGVYLFVFESINDKITKRIIIN